VNVRPVEGFRGERHGVQRVHYTAKRTEIERSAVRCRGKFFAYPIAHRLPLVLRLSDAVPPWEPFP
jgi:hypothetical protein